jgi:hypothetical protein
MEQAKIQMQDHTGRWVTVQSVMPSEQLMYQKLQSVQQSYKRSVRAVDARGIVLQFFPYIGDNGR